MPLVSKADAISTSPAAIAQVTAATDPPPGAGVRAACRLRTWRSVTFRYGSEPTSGSLEEPNRPAVLVDPTRGNQGSPAGPLLLPETLCDAARRAQPSCRPRRCRR